MKIHYYLGWFEDYFPEKLREMLLEDIKVRKSLVMISSNPSLDDLDGSIERSWLEEVEITFDEYHLINYRIGKDEAKRLIQDASVIFLLGGYVIQQNHFMKEYELADLIKDSSSIVMGASAGAINMSLKWLGSKKLGFDVEETTIFEGIGLSNFSVLSHYDLENNMELIQSELARLSEEMNIYASNKDCAVRVKEETIDIIGDVYIISHSKIQKLREIGA